MSNDDRDESTKLFFGIADYVRYKGNNLGERLGKLPIYIGSGYTGTEAFQKVLVELNAVISDAERAETVLNALLNEHQRLVVSEETMFLADTKSNKKTKKGKKDE